MECTFRTILAAVDGSPRAAGVAHTAFEIAARFGGTVHLYRAIEMPPDLAAAGANQPDTLQPFLEQRVRRELEALGAGKPDAVMEPPAVLHGQPWRDILATAQRLNADLIVIGSHGYGGWDRVLGTTTSKVALHADRCVLVVHEPQDGQRKL
ncbi:MAG TPA: universal stress protein [Myxococcales bacterium]|nr:universal stress protein [Myxococcales bacterium]